MQKLTTPLLVTLFLLFSATDLRAQQPTSQSLLWRITGNGLTSPSYLFGTMHVKNKQAFHFKDSLYHFIEQAQGFALELHPDSMGQVITAMLKGSIDIDELRPGNDFSEKDIEKIASKISKDKSFSKKSKKEKMDIIMSKMMEEKEQKDNSMSTFMDAFLYSLALENGKKIFGLEEVKDQVKAFKHLRNGIRMNELAKRIDKINWDASPPIYEYYYRERLDSIDNFYTSFFSDSALKGFLYDRNIVMANKFDSLVQLQTMFTAVGAGHLPGEKGVIALLRQKGYTVEPVFSQKKIFAGDYARKEYQEEWAKNNNEVGGYEFETPKPVTKQAGANGGTAEYSLDLVHGMMFMVVSGVIKPELRKYGPDTVFAINHKAMLENIKGFLVSKKDIEVNGLKGIETMIGTMNDGYSRIYHLFDATKFYILLVSSEKKADLSSKRVDRFVQSFKAKAPKETEWSLFKDQQAGFAIQFPYQPAVEAFSDEENPQVSQSGYTSFDPFSNTSYAVYFTKATPGYELLTPSLFFNSYTSNLKDITGDKEFVERDSVIAGYPAKVFEAVREGGEVIKGLLVRRNNVAYFVTAEYHSAGANTTELDKYFSSFVLSAFPEHKWSVNKADNFSAWAPSSFEKKEQDFDKNNIHYIARHPLSATGYHVEVTDLGKYFWTANADSALNYWKNKLVSEYADTIITDTKIDQGGIVARNLVVQKKEDKTSKRYLFFLNGNSVYMAYADVLAEMDESAETKKFFTSFSPLKRETSEGLYIRKADQLFNALLSSDSAVFAEAFYALSDVQFSKTDLPLLLGKILQPYPVHEFIYISVQDKLWQLADELADDDPVLRKQINQFVKENYAKTDEIVLSQRLRMLTALAESKTADAFVTINDYLDNYPVTGKDNHYFFSTLTDSLQLSKTLYPGLFKHIKDTLIDMGVASLTLTMLDSNMLSVNMVKEVEPDFIELLKNKLADVADLQENDFDYDYKIEYLLSLVGGFKTKEAEAVLKKYAKIKMPAIRFAAVEAQLKGGFAVSGTDIKNFAGLKRYRVRLYEAMKKYGKQSSFPPEQATQTAMAKSYLFNTLDEDEYMEEDGVEFVFLKKVETVFKGEMKRFLLFRSKFRYENEEEGNTTYEEYLMVAGPFSLNEKEILVDAKDNFSGMYYDEKFDAKKVDEFFKKYIEDTLKYYTN